MANLWPWRLLRDEGPPKLRRTTVALQAIRKQQTRVTERKQVLARIARWISRPLHPKRRARAGVVSFEAVDVWRC